MSGSPGPELAQPSSRRPFAATSGALLAALPLPWAIVAWVHGGRLDTSPWAWIGSATATLALLLAAITLGANARLGRWLATLGVVLLPTLAAERLSASPGLTLLLATAAALVLGVLWQLAAPLFVAVLQRGSPGAGRVRGSAALALGFWLVVGIGTSRDNLPLVLAVAASMTIAVAIGVAWLVQRRRATSPRTRTVAGGLLAAGLLAVATGGEAWALVSSGAVYALVATVFGPRAEFGDRPASRWWTSLLEHPERLFVSSFATLIGVGTVVLALPQCSANDAGIGIVDAAFTATSAVCVTGLIVRDTPTEFSALGQVVLLLLIQLGGLGIMTFSTAALRVLGGRLSLRTEAAVARWMGTNDRSRLITSAQDVLRVTFVVETVGALLLAALFVAAGDGIGQALWRGVFTSVSAFCNAGFALQTDNLMPYRDAPLVLHTIALLIVCGGLSPAVVLALVARREPGRRQPMQVRICLVAAAVLIAVGFVVFLTCEWENSLAGLSLADKVHNAWFQSITLRTAGFNSVDLSAVHPATWLTMLCLMFIGGSPGGTAGGVKTTTITVLLVAVVSTIRGRRATTVFGRRIPEPTVQRAAVIVTTAIVACGIGLFTLLLTQRIPLPMLGFEVVSALGTVGLSQGATLLLDDVGKVLVMALMFVGRTGGLTIMMFMSQRSRSREVALPHEDIEVG
ncbi:MAG: potassium transporter TrkH [Planctomycetes bacterium]|nr:potassium transporter TrkH [Planctomycetota bacterium]